MNKLEVMEMPVIIASEKSQNLPMHVATIKIEYVPLVCEPWMIEMAVRRACKDLTTSLGRDQLKPCH